MAGWGGVTVTREEVLQGMKYVPASKLPQDVRGKLAEILDPRQLCSNRDHVSFAGYLGVLPEKVEHLRALLVNEPMITCRIISHLIGAYGDAFTVYHIYKALQQMNSRGQKVIWDFMLRNWRGLGLASRPGEENLESCHSHCPSHGHRSAPRSPPSQHPSSMPSANSYPPCYPDVVGPSHSVADCHAGSAYHEGDRQLGPHGHEYRNKSQKELLTPEEENGGGLGQSGSGSPPFYHHCVSGDWSDGSYLQQSVQLTGGGCGPEAVIQPGGISPLRGPDSMGSGDGSCLNDLSFIPPSGLSGDSSTQAGIPFNIPPKSCHSGDNLDENIANLKLGEAVDYSSLENNARVGHQMSPRGHFEGLEGQQMPLSRGFQRHQTSTHCSSEGMPYCTGPENHYPCSCSFGNQAMSPSFKSSRSEERPVSYPRGSQEPSDTKSQLPRRPASTCGHFGACNCPVSPTDLQDCHQYSIGNQPRNHFYQRNQYSNQQPGNFIPSPSPDQYTQAGVASNPGHQHTLSQGMGCFENSCNGNGCQDPPLCVTREVSRSAVAEANHQTAGVPPSVSVSIVLNQYNNYVSNQGKEKPPTHGGSPKSQRAVQREPTPSESPAFNTFTAKINPLSAGSSCRPCLQHGPQELPALKGLPFLY